MCVIIVKPAGVALPAYEILKAASIANPDGFGFASPSAQYKTLSFAQFMRALKRVQASEPCIMHFRLATHGSVSRHNCHPFNRGDVWFAHNGILSIRSKGDMTDSETAFEDILYPAIERHGFFSDELNYAVFNILGASKFAFLQGNKVRLFGGFIKDEDGCFYSNQRFMPMCPSRNARLHGKHHIYAF